MAFDHDIDDGGLIGIELDRDVITKNLPSVGHDQRDVITGGYKPFVAFIDNSPFCFKSSISVNNGGGISFTLNVGDDIIAALSVIGFDVMGLYSICAYHKIWSCDHSVALSDVVLLGAQPFETFTGFDNDCALPRSRLRGCPWVYYKELCYKEPCYNEDIKGGALRFEERHYSTSFRVTAVLPVNMMC